MGYIQSFDPWKSAFCTCPAKYSLNPYTGCAHRCLYCYATSFIKNFYYPRPKKEFLKVIKKELEKLPKGALLSLSNSSDPYQPLEKIFHYTRNFLEMLLRKDFKILIITKSSLILRDLELLKNIRCAVSITLTSKSLNSKLEPGAPSYEERLEAIKVLSQRGIPVSVRLDPIIPKLNEEELLEILEEVAPWIKHLTVSTYKAKFDSFKRLGNAFPELKKDWEKLYFKDGEKYHGSFYLKKELRYTLIKPFYEKAQRYGLSFATCREILKDFENPKRCDGSFLIPNIVY
ncbi:MAG: radical SAM protein [Thermodesulfobacteriaceae bacterium]|nr:radical SAM protein [Thermodesulfobacteriaceae bacterium]MCX8041590.1 radical SAM protein [Thermodesulfobacteriaceae bacterium]MDW8136558.1 radical SAM protein [Thermodesulfobacterium sp.]